MPKAAGRIRHSLPAMQWAMDCSSLRAIHCRLGQYTYLLGRAHLLAKRQTKFHQVIEGGSIDGGGGRLAPSAALSPRCSPACCLARSPDLCGCLIDRARLRATSSAFESLAARLARPALDTAMGQNPAGIPTNRGAGPSGDWLAGEPQPPPRRHLLVVKGRTCRAC